MLQILIVLWVGLFSSFQAPPLSCVQWLDETEYEFGDIAQHQPVTHTFTFKNISDTPITIENIRTTCGCTGTTWSEEPVMPDSTSVIKVEYDAKQPGYFHKYAKVYFYKQRGAEKLWIKGFVVEKEH